MRYTVGIDEAFLKTCQFGINLYIWRWAPWVPLITIADEVKPSQKQNYPHPYLPDIRLTNLILVFVPLLVGGTYALKTAGTDKLL